MTTEYDHVDWRSGTDSTLLYDPRFRFPPEELVALARAHARCPGLVQRDLRRHMDAEDVARVFGLDAVGVVGGGSGSTTPGFAAEYGTTTTEGDAAGFYYYDEPAGYVAVEEPAGELVDYVLVGTADEVEREQRLEADAEAGCNEHIRSIEELPEDAGVEEEVAARDAGGKKKHDDVPSVEQLSDLDDEEEDAITARRKKLIRDIDRSLEEDAALDLGLENVTRTIEQHFACADNEAAVPE
jgi:hypothetical protein